MRIRRRALHLLLLAPVFANSVALAAADDSQSRLARRDNVDEYSDLPDSRLNTQSSRADVGTKDAPVDGQDGKPHKGPWVDSSSSEDDTSKKSSSSSTTHKSSDAHGVMDDPNREAPKKGTTGTEGGISEKGGDFSKERNPESPKEAPASTDIDAVTGEEVSASKAKKIKSGVGIEKPDDLPEKPHDIPPPPPPTVPNDSPYDSSRPLTTYPKTTTSTSHDDDDDEDDDDDDDDEDREGVIQPFHSLVLSFAMIVFSEIGDKTFLVAALMAMRHPRLLVFSAAFAALMAMTVLSALLGHAVPALLSKRFTSFLAAILFFVFGARLLREGFAMSPDEGVGEEMREVEQELEEKEHQALKQGRKRSDVTAYALEAGRGRRSPSNSRLPAPPRSPSSSASPPPVNRGSAMESILAGMSNLFSLLLSPAWVQTFVMTFLGEWGDRSQIATIAMATGQDYWWVTIGAISGHALCTAAAVIGGRAIAGRVSMRKVTLGGATAFLFFGLVYLIEAYSMD